MGKIGEKEIFGSRGGVPSDCVGPLCDQTGHPDEGLFSQ